MSAVKKTFENTAGKREIAHNKQFLFFPQCFLPFRRTFCHFHQIQNSALQTLSVWKSPKFVVWKRVKWACSVNLGATFFTKREVQLTLYHTIRSFNNPERECILIHCWRGRKCWSTVFSPFPFNPLSHNDTFWRPLETRLLQTLWEKEKLLVTSNFSISHNVFYPFG